MSSAAARPAGTTSKPAAQASAPATDKSKPANGSAAAATTAAGAATGAAPAAGAKKLTGTHNFMVHTSKFTVDAKYHPLKPLGRGAYGVVCSAVDKLHNDKKIAIKKVPRAFEDLVDAKRILREIKLLRHFRHENIIGLYDLIPPPEAAPFDDIYIILDFMETDLHQIIYSKNDLTDEHIQYFVYQILRGLKFIHSANVIHRDLKPSNLLLNGNCDLKICDFGLSRGVKTDENSVDYELTEYVVTRWYRAPEVMCSCQAYDFKIDMWAVGCILGEILGRKPLFPGDDYIKQMNLIFATLGTPQEADMKFISNAKAAEYIRSLKRQPKVPFATQFPKANPLALDLLDKMLTFNPHKRIGVEEALRHPYLKGLHNPKAEPSCKAPFDFEFERVDFTKDLLREAIWDEVLMYRPDMKSRREKWSAHERERRAKAAAAAAAGGSASGTGSLKGAAAAALTAGSGTGSLKGEKAAAVTKAAK